MNNQKLGNHVILLITNRTIHDMNDFKKILKKLRKTIYCNCIKMEKKIFKICFN